MSGWKQAATVAVISHPGYAYQELWKNFLDTFLLFSLMAATAILLGIVAVYLLLQPLKRVEEQAEAICQKTFVIQKKLPRTRELRRVVETMNRLAGKVNKFFTEQASLTERLREQVYRDPVTGLGNRRYFDRRLQSSLESREDSLGGTVLLLELNQLKHINTTSGYQAGDVLLHRTAELVQTRLADSRTYFLSRLSGAGFGVVVEGIDSLEADALADSLCRDLLQLRSEDLVKDGNIAHIGLTMWKPGDSMPDVLAKADNALRAAQVSGDNAWRRYEPINEVPCSIPGAVQWYSYLKRAVSSASATLCAQPVVEFTGAGDTLLHREVFLRLPDESGNIMTAGIFMPVAERSGLAVDLDRLAVVKLLDYLSVNPDDTCRYAVNLTASSLHDSAFVEWLCREPLADNERSRRIAFEFPESGVLRNIETARTVVDKLSALGCDSGIDHFGRGFNSFGYLRKLGVQYIKIDGGYSRNIHHESDNQFLIKALADAAHSVDIRVFAEAVESREELEVLRTLNVDGVQGYLVGKPEFL